MINRQIINFKDGDVFFQIDSKVSYGRSPIKIQPLIKFDTLKILTTSSTLVTENRFKVITGTKWYDFLPFNNSSDFAISERVKNTLESHKVTGIWYFPIIIENYPDKLYYCFAVTSIAGKILNLEKLNNYEEEHIKFDIETWDESDIFNLEETLIIACTKKVADLLTKEEFTNLEIKEL